MNIQKLHDRFIKKASIAKVAGSGADKLRRLIADLNKIRGDKKIVDALKDVPSYPATTNLLGDAVRLYRVPNKSLDIPYDLPKLRSSYPHRDADLNKLIDKIRNIVQARYWGIRTLEGPDAANAFEHSLINKYIKDIPSK